MKTVLFIALFIVSACKMGGVDDSTLSSGVVNDGESRSRGYYTNGCLQNSEEFVAPEGMHILRPWRDRSYGHSDMVSFLEDLGSTMSSYGETIMVGDIAQKFGGRMTFGHKSHQTGLGVDIFLQSFEEFQAWNDLYNNPEQKTSLQALEKTQKQLDLNYEKMASLGPSSLNYDKKREKIQKRIDLLQNKINELETIPRDFVKINKKKWRVELPEGVWSDRVEQMILNTARDERVQRVLVNPVIKKKLCDLYKNDKDYDALLKKIRIEQLHTSHMHVRLFCPDNSPKCKPQAEVTGNNGCSFVPLSLSSPFNKGSEYYMKAEKLALGKTPRKPRSSCP